MNFNIKILMILSIFIITSSCYNRGIDDKYSFNKNNNIGKYSLSGDKIDPLGNKKRNDYYDHFLKDTSDKINKKNTLKESLPTLSSMILPPKKPKFKNNKLVTISVTDDVPIKDVFIELAKRGGVDIEIDKNITGGVILTANQKPFSEVVERLAHLADLIYTVENGVLKVKKDRETVVNYRLNMLNVKRNSNSTISTSNTLGGGSSSDGGSSGGISNGSQSSLSIESGENDVWQIVENGVSSIIAQYRNGRVVSNENISLSPSVSSNSTSSNNRGIISVNKGAGIISILANSKQHEEIKQYLDYIQISYTSQVLIEAKILEVALNDEFRSGVDWSVLSSSSQTISAGSNFSDLGIDNAADASKIFNVGVVSNNFLGLDSALSLQSAINLVESFGIARTLSSPRLHAMNNQHAVLSFATNHVYFEMTVEEEEEESDSGSTDRTVTVESEIKTVPIGVVLNLQPSIDVKRNEVIMNIRPTLTRITRTEQDPGVAIVVAGLKQQGVNIDVTSEIPVVSVRELDTVLRLKSGQVMVIGGLLDEKVDNSDRGIPAISKIPLLGRAFKSSQKTSSMVETVIFIKATIVPGYGVTVEDRDFYRGFAADRHSLGI